MEFGLFLSQIDFAAVRESARNAEQMGFDLVVFPDHFVHEGPGGEYNPHTLAHDAIMLAAAAAEATRKIRIGHLVLCNLFRHPAVTAQALMSLDHLSGGRAVAGLGAGWMETEFRMTGIGFPDVGARLRMLDEALTCMKSLWTQERTTFSGEFYRLSDAILWPKPLQRPHPPILIGGSGHGALRVMAKHADIANIAVDTGRPGKLTLEAMSKVNDAVFKERAGFVRAEAARLGRDPKAITISNAIFAVMLADSAAAAKASAREVGKMFGIRADDAPRSALFLIGTPEQCAEELNRRAAQWGVGQFLLNAGSLETIRRLAHEVLPRVRR
ncbi:MAG TPA: LLM class flavin-dependent oxidoreductase [Candidatus Binataceae bacterium]|nr:LLM class flavin-dependent oxidoreductase [Candidatus Binataceae bacterium]